MKTLKQLSDLTGRKAAIVGGAGHIGRAAADPCRHHGNSGEPVRMTRREHINHRRAVRMARGVNPAAVERVLRAYMAHRTTDGETFLDFCRRHEVDDLRKLAELEVAA